MQFCVILVYHVPYLNLVQIELRQKELTFLKMISFMLQEGIITIGTMSGIFTAFLLNSLSSFSI
jgi:hypothetical protein